MTNRVVLVGRLTKDPVRGKGDTPVVRFTLAVSRNFKNAQGEVETDFIPVTVWRKQAENAEKYLTKGSLVSVDGRIQTGSYEKDKQRVYTTEINAENVQYLDTKNSKANQDGEESSSPSQSTQQNSNPTTDQKVDQDPFDGTNKIEVSDDDLPF